MHDASSYILYVLLCWHLLNIWVVGSKRFSDKYEYYYNDKYMFTLLQNGEATCCMSYFEDMNEAVDNRDLIQDYV